ncbi:MAG: UDP-N-acetylglucosamine 2-epimerase [Bdellovibrionales bacterium]|nr:UDP-N-acetylglucosamine 2-epimerase [Bdellovibrionales bacterium]
MWFVLGTAGELIKMYPVIEKCHKQGLRWSLIHTGQSGVNFWRQWQSFNLPEGDQVNRLFDSRSDLRSSAGAAWWFFRFLLRSKDEVLSWQQVPSQGDRFIVHGDTLSTLAGAILAKRFGGLVHHVEAGLRSEDLLEPFPEEISRRLTSALADVHYAPDQRAYDNLQFAGCSGRIVGTGGNTLIDSILSVAHRELAEAPLTTPYVVANLHRYENLSNPARWKMLVETTLKAQELHQVVFAMHPPTEAKLAEDTSAKADLENSGVMLKPRLPFELFVMLLHGSEFVISDGGSNQEECYYMGKPCLILRDTTERTEGLGENAVLSQLNERVIDDFLSNYRSYERSELQLSQSPSQQIANDLMMVCTGIDLNQDDL